MINLRIEVQPTVSNIFILKIQRQKSIEVETYLDCSLRKAQGLWMGTCSLSFGKDSNALQRKCLSIAFVICMRRIK